MGISYGILSIMLQQTVQGSFVSSETAGIILDVKGPNLWAVAFQYLAVLHKIPLPPPASISKTDQGF